MFNVQPPDKERWIFIFTDDINEPNEFILLVKAYQSDVIHQFIVNTLSWIDTLKLFKDFGKSIIYCSVNFAACFNIDSSIE